MPFFVSVLLPSLGMQTPGVSPRAREQAKSLSTAIQGVLCGVRSSSRPGRAKLTDALAVDENEVLRLASGARMGLKVISALEEIVSDEGEVRAVLFAKWPATIIFGSSGIRD